MFGFAILRTRALDLKRGRRSVRVPKAKHLVRTLEEQIGRHIMTSRTQQEDKVLVARDFYSIGSSTLGDQPARLVQSSKV